MNRVRGWWLSIALTAIGCGGGSVAPIDTELLVVPEQPVYAGPDARFEFRGAGPVARFEARVDGGAFFAVESPFEWTAPDAGEHTFEVCAVDADGRRDPTPAVHTWHVGPPIRTVVVDTPPQETARDTATFRFESHVEQAVFHGRLDNRDLGVVVSPLVLRDLEPGTHTLELWAVAPDGWVEEDPVVWSWSVVVPDVEITFPPPQSVTSANRIAVCGTVRSDFGVAGVIVNGETAKTSNDFKTWVAEIPVKNGTTNIHVRCIDSEGTVVELDGPVVESRGPFLQDPSGVAFDAEKDRVLVLDVAKRALIAVDIESGQRTVLTDEWPVPDGVNFAAYPVEFDAVNRRVFTLHTDGSVSAIDVDTGQPSLVLDADAADIGTPRGLAYDSAGDRLFVSDVSECTIHEFGLKVRSHRIASSATQGRGTDIGLISDIAWDAARVRILLADEAAHGLIAIDPESGDRTAIQGVTLYAQRVVVDGERDEAIVLGGGVNQLVRWDLVGGGRAAIHTDSVIGSWWPSAPLAVDVAGHRAFLVNGTRNDVTLVDLNGGEDDVVISGDQVGSGVMLGGYAQSGAIDAAFDTARDRTLVAMLVKRGILADYAVFSIDRATGRRDVVSSMTTFHTRGNEIVRPRGSGPAFTSINEIVVDESRGRILVLDERDAAVIAVDPVSGDRSILAREADGAASRRRWSQMALDGDRVVVTAEGNRYLAVDLESGEITQLPATLNSAEGHVAGLADITFVKGDKRLYVADMRLRELIAVDLQSGVCEVQAPLPRDLRAMEYDADRHCMVFLRTDAVTEWDLERRALRVVTDDHALGEAPTSGRAMCLDPSRRCAQVMSFGGRKDVRGLFTVELETGACVIASKD